MVVTWYLSSYLVDGLVTTATWLAGVNAVAQTAKDRARSVRIGAMVTRLYYYYFVVTSRSCHGSTYEY
jgi:hypothetical protein